MTQAIKSLQPVATVRNFDTLDYDPLELPQVASRLATAMVDQALGEDPSEVDEELTLAQEAETEAQAEAEDESVDAVPAQGTSPQYADLPQQAAAPTPAATIPTNAQPELANRILRWMLQQPGGMPAEAAGVAVSFPTCWQMWTWRLC